MKLFRRVLWIPIFLFSLCIVPAVHAAAAPSLGAADTFGVLTYLYGRFGIPGPIITGDFGYSILTGSSPMPVVSGSTHVADSIYAQAELDENTAWNALENATTYPCTHNFAGSSVDLATQNVGSGIGIYPPGVYCTSMSTSIVNIGAGGITLNGSGTYIFRFPNGVLITSPFSVVSMQNGASSCGVFWLPDGPAILSTFGHDSTFVGTVFSHDGYNVNDGVTWFGRALTVGGGTVNMASDESITVPTGCTPPPSTGTLHVIKQFYNDYGGTAVATDANVYVKSGATNVAGSPHAGANSPGTLYTLNVGTYVVSEDAYPGYSPTIGGDCDASGHVTLTAGQNKTCIIANDQNPPPPTPNATLHVIKHVVNDNGGISLASSFLLHVKGSGGMGVADVLGSPLVGAESPGTTYSIAAGVYVVSEDAFSGYTSTFSGDCDATGNITLASSDNKTCTITNNDIAPLLATLHIIKHVVNDNGGVATASSFNLHVKSSGGMGVVDVSGSPAVGAESPGTTYGLTPGMFVVSEDVHSGYTSTFSGDCDASGNITIVASTNKTCTITNNDDTNTIITTTTSDSGSATLHVIKVVVNDNGGKAVVSDAMIHVVSGTGEVSGSPQKGAISPGTLYTLNAGTYTVSENFFPGYAVLVSGDCSVNGTVVLASGDNKTCTITNNDTAVVTVTPPTIIITPVTVTPPTIVPPTCDICSRLTYDVYIINPDKSERHTGTAWVRVTDRGNGVKRYSFEDATIDPKNPLFDYNDSVIDVDYKDCKNARFMFVSSDASWKHQVKIKISVDGVTQSDSLVADDSKAVVGTIKVLNATTGVNTKIACAPSTTPLNLLGKILLQVQQHGEAWYVRPVTGQRYYMKDGLVAYGIMRNFGLGITDKNLARIPSVATVAELKASTSVCVSNASAKNQAGKILLQVQQHGEAWYVDATKCRRIYLKDGAAAYSVMRFLGLGIADTDLAKIKIGT